MLKNLLNAIHDVAHSALHIVLIPVIAVLKAAITLLTHLETELSKL